MMEIKTEYLESPNRADRLVELLLELDQTFIPKLSDRVNIYDYSEKLATRAELFYACYNGMDIGNCAVYMNDVNNGYISSLAVKKEWQGFGVGTLLWNKVLSVAKEKNIKKIYLHVHESNEQAKVFYQKMGLEKTQEHDHWIKMIYILEESGNGEGEYVPLLDESISIEKKRELLIEMYAKKSSTSCAHCVGLRNDVKREYPAQQIECSLV